jgi:2-polyprenyl-6-hydroxyphenyl methylase/3-demethylubiquinone-9 3-methyltransferase
MTNDVKTHQAFVDYTTAKLNDPALAQRFISLKDHCEKFKGRPEIGRDFKVLDVGCGMGVQASIWAADGYCVTGVDIDQSLLQIGKNRAEEKQLNIHWVQASAIKLPFADECFDICLSIELLEHIADWQTSLSELNRVVKPGGLVLLTTTNKICPFQNEFNLPFYSWWPKFAKSYVEHLALTKRPDLANFASFPAVNWFSFYGLRKEFNKMNFDVWDRFDAMKTEEKSAYIRWITIIVRKFFLARLFFYFFFSGTMIYAVKAKKEIIVDTKD